MTHPTNTVILSDEEIMLCIVHLYEKHGSPGIGELRLQSDMVPIGRAIERAFIEKLGASDAAPAAWVRKTDITELTDSEPETDGWHPLYDANALTQARQQGYEAARAELIPLGCSVRDRGFEVDGGTHSPTVLLEFNTDDWDARDKVAAMYAARQPTQKEA